MKLFGARIIKTGIAVAITMFICESLGLEPAVFGAVSAVINMQPSVYLTLSTTKDQVLMHLLGVLAGIVYGYLFGGSPLSMGIVTVFLIVLYTRLDLKNGITMGIVAAIFILGSSPDQFLSHAISRSAVIFIGLSVALIVNFTLWPPRYGRRLVEKLRQSNDEAVAYFCQAVSDFVRLENQEIYMPQEKRDEVLALLRETRTMAEHFRKEREFYYESAAFSHWDEWFLLSEKLLDYNEALTDRADQIYEALRSRLERRLKSGVPPISSEFHSILEILANGCTTISRVNSKLKALICDDLSVEPEEISEAYWTKLTAAIEQWQPKLSGTYYLHALIEVAVVANEIRWAAREGKKMLWANKKFQDLTQKAMV